MYDDALSRARQVLGDFFGHKVTDPAELPAGPLLSLDGSVPERSRTRSTGGPAGRRPVGSGRPSPPEDPPAVTTTPLLTEGLELHQNGSKSLPRKGLGSRNSVTVDYLTLSSAWSPDQAKILLEDLAGWSLADWEPATPRWQHKEAAAHPSGALLMWGHPKRRRGGALLSLPGKALRELRQAGADVLQVLRAARQAGEDRVTRIDLAFDDFGKSRTPRQVRASWYRERVSRCKSARWIESTTGNRVTGETFYIGSESSPRRLRIYDKEAESRGRIRAIRWELQLRSDSAAPWAQRAAAELISGRDLREVFGICLVGLVDFRKGKGNVSRRERCPWFRRLVGECQAARLDPPPEKEVDLAEAEERMRISAKVASMMLDVHGGDVDYLLDQVVAARARWKPRDRHRVEHWRAQFRRRSKGVGISGAAVAC